MSIIFLHSYGIFTTLSPRTPTDHPLPPSTNNPDRPFDRYLPAPFRVPNLPTLRYFPLRGAEPCTSGCRTLQPRNSSPSPTENDNDYSQPLFNLGPQPTRPSHPSHLPNRPALFPAPFRVPNLPTLRYFPLQGAEPCSPETRMTFPPETPNLAATQLSSPRNFLPTENYLPPDYFDPRFCLRFVLFSRPFSRPPLFQRHRHHAALPTSRDISTAKLG